MCYTEARRLCLIILDSLLFPNEERFVEQALVSLIEELAQCESDWPELVPKLVLCIRPGHCGARVATMTLTAIAQDCTNSAFNSGFSSAQRSMLMRHMRPQIPSIFRQLNNAIYLPDLTLACLECTSMWLGWIPLNDVSVLHSILDAVIMMASALESSRTRAAAVAVLSQFASRKTSDLERALPKGVQWLYEAIQNAVERILQSPVTTADETHACALALTQVLENHISALQAIPNLDLCSNALLLLTQKEESCLQILPGWFGRLPCVFCRKL